MSELPTPNDFQEILYVKQLWHAFVDNNSAWVGEYFNGNIFWTRTCSYNLYEALLEGDRLYATEDFSIQTPEIRYQFIQDTQHRNAVLVWKNPRHKYSMTFPEQKKVSRFGNLG
jgi:hypothetical protein